MKPSRHIVVKASIRRHVEPNADVRVEAYAAAPFEHCQDGSTTFSETYLVCTDEKVHHLLGRVITMCRRHYTEAEIQKSKATFKFENSNMAGPLARKKIREAILRC